MRHLVRWSALVLAVGCGGEESAVPVPMDTQCQGAVPPVTCSAGPHVSPFTCVRFNRDCTVDVQLAADGPWYHWDAIDRVTTQGIVNVAKKQCAATWKMRVAEDLGAMLAGTCATMGDTAQLTLRDLDTGVTQVVRAAVTGENRARVKACWPTVDQCK